MEKVDEDDILNCGMVFKPIKVDVVAGVLFAAMEYPPDLDAFDPLEGNNADELEMLEPKTAVDSGVKNNDGSVLVGLVLVLLLRP